MTNAEIQDAFDQLGDLVARLVAGGVDQNRIRYAVHKALPHDESLTGKLLKEYVPKVSNDDDSHLVRAYKTLALSNLIDAARGDDRYIP
jgi:hypothetical protein